MAGKEREIGSKSNIKNCLKSWTCMMVYNKIHDGIQQNSGPEAEVRGQERPARAAQ